MDSAGLMTAIAILAAVWVQTGYEERLRLRVARWQPLRTGIFLLLSITAGLAGAEYANKAGTLNGEWLALTGAGGALAALAVVGWVLKCSTKTTPFDKWNAHAYEGLMRETVNAGKLEELRILAEALRVSGPRLVAEASHLENCKQGTREHNTAVTALRGCRSRIDTKKVS